MDAVAEQSIHRKFEMLGAILDDRGRRLWAAVEASQLGRGGVSAVARATGLSQTTLYQGTEELNQSRGTGALRRERVRAPGGGRKRLTVKDPALRGHLERWVEPVTRDDPQSPLRWTCKSTRQLAEALEQQGHPIGRQKVAELLAELGYRL
jgi:transposase-like protein